MQKQYFFFLLLSQVLEVKGSEQGKSVQDYQDGRLKSLSICKVTYTVTVVEVEYLTFMST